MDCHLQVSNVWGCISITMPDRNVFYLGVVYLVLSGTIILAVSVCVLVCVCLFVCLSVCRAGQRGNLTERVTASVLSLLLIFSVFVGVLYLLLWQSYVLWLEAVLVFIEMAFLALEVIFALITVVTFARFFNQRLEKYVRTVQTYYAAVHLAMRVQHLLVLNFSRKFTFMLSPLRIVWRWAGSRRK